jgi:hypothetical protein
MPEWMLNAQEIRMSCSTWAAIWTLVASAIAAVAASIGNLVANRRTARLQAQLDFVNVQLKDFYGPLLAAVKASEQAWVIFKDHYKSEASSDLFWDPEHPPTREARIAYQHWTETVFHLTKRWPKSSPLEVLVHAGGTTGMRNAEWGKGAAFAD